MTDYLPKTPRRIPFKSKVLFILAFICFTLPLTSRLYTGQTGQFIVASEKLDAESENPFRRSVVYILGHGFKGAGGIVLNQQLAAYQMNRLPNFIKGRALNMFWGGPMEFPDRISVLTLGPVTGDVRYDDLDDLIASDPDYLVHIEQQAKSGWPRFYIGYAAWDPLQLEREIRRKRWLVGDPDWSVVGHNGGSDMWQILYNRYREAARYGSKQSF